MSTIGRPRALEVLGLQHSKCTLTADVVQEAFKAAARKAHPDSPDFSADGWDAGARMAEINDARAFLLKNLTGDADFACKLCQGLGMVRAQIGWLKCSACKGTGEKR